MKNTFWTLIEDKYYRVHNGVLKYAPICDSTSNVLTKNESTVEVISAEQLEVVNTILGTSFIIDDFI